MGCRVYVQHPLSGTSDSFPVTTRCLHTHVHKHTHVHTHTRVLQRGKPAGRVCPWWAGCHLPLGSALERSWEQPASPLLSSCHCWRLWGFKGHHAANEGHQLANMLGGGCPPLAQVAPHLLLLAPGSPSPCHHQRWVPHVSGGVAHPHPMSVLGLVVRNPLPVAVWPRRKSSGWW